MTVDLRASVARVLEGVLKREVRPGVDAEVPLRELGLASLRMIQLIGDLESSFGIRVEDEDVEPENFDTLAALARFVDRKRGGRA